MWVIAWVLSKGGWCVVDFLAVDQVKAGPYTTHADAVEAAQSMGWRIAQGWAP